MAPQGDVSPLGTRFQPWESDVGREGRASNPMRILIATNRLESFSGSEIVALELAEEFTSRGHTALLLANSVSEEIAEEAGRLGVEVWTRDGLPDLSSFDLLWSQHYVLPMLLGDAPECPNRPRPFFVLAHLGPSDPCEAALPIVEEIVADRVFANSPETRDKLVSEGVDPHRIDVFHNAAPAVFARSPAQAPGTFRRLLVIGNSLPDEVVEAVGILRAQELLVTRIGAGGEIRRVRPGDLHRADALLAIGKSVQYALRSAVPVFCYGHFGGPGWLDSTNFARAEYFNFSGRCCRWKRRPAEIVSALVEGWHDAARFAARIGREDPPRFRLERCVEGLLSAAAQSRAWGAEQCSALRQQWPQIVRLRRMSEAVRREVRMNRGHVLQIKSYMAALAQAEALAIERLRTVEQLSAQSAGREVEG